MLIQPAASGQAGSAGIWPGGEWPRATPESQGMSLRKLEAVPATIGDAVVIRNGYQVHSWGDARQSSWWSSVARSFVTTAYGRLIQERVIKGGAASVGRPVASLKSATARRLPADVQLRHLLSYTSCSQPPGNRWQYSCKWIELNRIAEELADQRIDDYVSAAILGPLGGDWHALVESDGTLRIVGSPSDLARWGYLWLREGQWKNRQLAPEWFVRKSTRPLRRTDGAGFAEENEGWQIHLNRRRQWKGCPKDAYAAIGSDGGTVVLVVPSRDLVVARAGGVPAGNSHDDVVSRFLGPVCRAAR